MHRHSEDSVRTRGMKEPPPKLSGTITSFSAVFVSLSAGPA